MGLHPQLGSFSERQSQRLYHLKCIGCVACRLRFGTASEGGEGHHAEDAGGRAISHDAIIVLCLWHHQGKVPHGHTKGTALEFYGPSRHGHAVAFAETFGTDLELLEVVNQFVEAYRASFVIPPSCL